LLQYAQSKGVPVLLDAKGGDIGNAAEQYARELFERFNADAMTSALMWAQVCKA
jgi:orotidine-5'-phosphate decarboxylase